MSNEAHITVRIPLHVEEFLKEAGGEKGAASWVREVLTDFAEGKTRISEEAWIESLEESHIKRGNELAAKTQECEALAAKVRDLEEKLAARMRVQAHGAPRKDEEVLDSQKVAKLAANDKPVDPAEKDRIAAMLSRTKPGSGKKPYMGLKGTAMVPNQKKLK